METTGNDGSGGGGGNNGGSLPDVPEQTARTRALLALATLADGLLIAGESPGYRGEPGPDELGALLVRAQQFGWEAPTEAIDGIWRSRRDLWWQDRGAGLFAAENGSTGSTGAAVAITSARSFLGAEREPLKYWIEPGILPERGKLLLTAAAKAGKTFWALNAALALASGGCKWLGLEFGDPAKVLLLQPELSDALLAARLEWVCETAPRQIALGRAKDNLSVWQCDVERPSLAESRREIVEEAVEETKPDVLVLDPLYALRPGLIENAAEEMSEFLDMLTGWATTYNLAIILTHHHGKGGVSRGSSVLQGWPETDLSMHAVDGDRDHLRVDGLFRCNYGTGWPAHWRKPDEHSGWFSLPDQDWEPPDGGSERKTTKKNDSNLAQQAADVAAILAEAKGPGLSHKALVDAVCAGIGCGKTTAKTRVQTALDAGAIQHQNGVYFVR